VKNEGDKVTADEPIIEIATDKVDSEVPSPEDGVHTELFQQETEMEVVQIYKNHLPGTNPL
jgi:2-oxoglutarate dehydrogenase E2 component (dihydrolipoamide succinyltransferase)